jgi:predicted dehydrogenase
VRRVRPRVGFAGLGWIGRQRLEAIAATGAVEVAGLQDPEPAALDAAAAVAPGAAAVGDYAALLDLGLDGIVIASPSALHAGQARAALDAGAAVFCQKPLARTAAEARGVVALARAADRLLAVDLCYPRTAAFGAIREVLKAGGIGRPFAADLVFHNAYGPDKPWFYDIAQSGGGAMMDLGTHLVDLVLDAFGGRRWRSRPISMPGAGGSRRRGSRTTPPRRSASRAAPRRGSPVPGSSMPGRTPSSAWRFMAARGALRSATAAARFSTSRPGGTAGRRASVIAAPPDDWGGRAAADWALRLARDIGFDPAAGRLVTLSETLDRIYAAGFGPAPRLRALA